MDYRLFEASLGGVDFAGLASEIVLLDIIEDHAKMDTQTVPLALRDGIVRTHNRRESLTVRIVYQIRTQDAVRRAEVHDLVSAWAMKGGALTVNTKPGKRLHVVCDTPPAQGSNGKWDNDLQIIFTAYAVPYWEDETETRLSVSTALNENTGQYYFANVIKPGGTVQKVPLEGTFLFFGTALNWLKIVCGDTFFEFNNLNLSRTNMLSISYNNGILTMYKTAATGTESIMPNRTPASSDELLAVSGKDNQVYVYSDAAISGSLICRGRWV